MEIRVQSGVGPQTIRHDLMLISLLYNTFKKWKRKNYVMEGIQFSSIKLPDDNPIADIRKPRIIPRSVLITPNEWARFMEHSSSRLRKICYWAIDTGMNECDLKKLSLKSFNTTTQTIRFVRSKTGHFQDIPLTDRCIKDIEEALANDTQNFLDFTNHPNEFKKTRKKAKVSFQFRDLRKANLNTLYRGSKGDIKIPQRMAGHTDPKTTLTHYIIDTGEDLRPHVQAIERRFK